jgi:putative OPT family oligopeptide transporter
MVVGGIASIFSVRKGLAKGLAALSGIKAEQSEVRTARDMGFSETTPLFVIAAIGTFGLYWALTSNGVQGLAMTIIMIIAAFFFVAVSSYIVGLVGSSNNPVSGMTITTVLFASGLLLVMGFKGDQGIIAALGIAGVVCCAACTAGDVSQDLKTGYLVGATPRYQQWAEIIGVAIPAFFIAPVLTILHQAHTIGSETLSAPQAGLFAGLAEGFFGDGQIPWTMVIIGMVIGLFLVMFNELLKAQGSRFRTHCMPVAVGLYLPIALSFPIFVGGLIRWLIIRYHSDRPKEELKQAEARGTLAASGLIAGEAVMGILVAGLVAANIDISWTDLLGIICLGIVISWVWRIATGSGSGPAQAVEDGPQYKAGFEKPEGGLDDKSEDDAWE